MAHGQLQAVVHYLHQLAGPSENRHPADEQLLERFIGQRDEAAFTTLVQRYGPLVLTVCRRILANAQDVEDAFQATFLILVRRAGSIAKRASLDSWLYGVARRVSLRAKADSDRRRAHERQSHPLGVPDGMQEVVWRDLRAMVDEEVHRLPPRCQAPFILCHLEGKTNEEAARILGCPKGTVLSRLARARQLLRTRLARRGLHGSAALVLTALSHETAAAVPPWLMAATVKAGALGVASRNGLATGPVAELVQGVLKTMGTTQLKLATLALLTIGILVGGAGLLIYRAQGEDQGPAPTAAAKKSPPAKNFQPRGDSPPRQLAKASGKDQLLNAARKEVLVLEDELQAREQKWTGEIIDARKKLVALEEALRTLEREQAAQRDRERAEAKPLEQRLVQLKMSLLDLGQMAKGDRAELEQRTRKQIAQVKEELEIQQARARRLEHFLQERLLETRQNLVAAEEMLRLLERRQTTQRARLQSRFEAAERRVEQLQGVALSIHGPAERRRQELEGKMDLLLRELTELRRDINKRR